MRRLWGSAPAFRELAGGASMSLSIRVIGTGTSFILQWILARALGVEEYGLYTWLMAWINLLLLGALVGQDAALLRFIPQYGSQERSGWVRPMIGHADRTALVGSVLLVALTVVALWTVPGLDPGGALRAFLPAAMLLYVVAVLKIRESALRAFRQVAAAQAPVLVLRPLLVIVLVVALWRVQGGSVSAGEVLLLNVVAVAAVLLVMHLLWRDIRPEPGAESVPQTERRRWRRTGLVLLGVSGLHETMRRFDILMLGSIAGKEDVAVYNIALLLARLISVGLEAVNTLQAPMISEYFANGRRRDLERVIRWSGWMTIGYTVPATLVLLFAGEWLLNLFGPEYGDGYPVLVLVAAGQVVNALVGPVGFLSMMTGHHRQAFVVMLAATASNIALNFALIPSYGMIGAAIASLAATVFWNISLHIWARRKLGISSTPLLAIRRS